MQLVELIFPAAPARIRAAGRSRCARPSRRRPSRSPTSPGFVVNRLLFPYLFSAVRLLEETGMDPARVDTCMRLGAGHPMGPLALLDLIGLDVSKAIGETIGETIPARVESLVAEGALGRKSGRGSTPTETSPAALLRELIARPTHADAVLVSPSRARETLSRVTSHSYRPLQHASARCHAGRTRLGAPPSAHVRPAPPAGRHAPLGFVPCGRAQPYESRSRELRAAAPAGARGCAPPRSGSRAPTPP